jgi:hypothetical protein
MSFAGSLTVRALRAKLLTGTGCTVAFALGFGLALAIPAYAATGSKFDGRWSIEVITEQGTCDKAYRYGVMIENGQTRYAGREDITVAGKVATDGRVAGSIAYKDNRADVSGALEASGLGSGSWKFEGANSSCKGRWNAERRG